MALKGWDRDEEFDAARHCFVLRLEFNRESKGNPSVAFRVISGGFYPIGEINPPEYCKRMWEKNEQVYEKAYSATIPTRDQHYWTGVMKVCYRAEGRHLWAGLILRGDRVWGKASNLTLNEEETKRWIVYLQRVVAAGLVLQVSKDGEVEVGRYKLRRNKWRFDKLDEDALKILGLE